MPYSPKKPCKYPNCPNLTHGRYCETHEPLYRRETAGGRGYTSRWNNRRKAYLAKHPLCAECERNGRIVPATVVDHIVPHRGNDSLMWDEANWQALCKPCHDKKTGLYDSRPAYRYNF
jgi:5-methylcytosine-specific restriction protein A